LEGGQLRGEIPGQQFLDAIDRVFRQSLEHLAQIGLDVSDGDALLAVMRNGLRYEELLQEELIPVEDLHKGKWHDA
jgi:hypothetical protein